MQPGTTASPTLLTASRRLTSKKGSVSRSVTHDSTLATLAQLFHSPARLVPEFSALIPLAALSSQRSHTLLLLRCEMLRALLERIDPDDPEVDAEALHTLREELAEFVRTWNRGGFAGSGSAVSAVAVLHDAAIGLAHRGHSGVLKASADSNVTPGHGEVSIPTPLSPTAGNPHSSQSLSSDKPFLAVLLIAALGVIALGVSAAALPAGTTGRILSGIAAAFPVAALAAAFLLHRRVVERRDAVERHQLEFLNLVYHAHVGGGVFSGSPSVEAIEDEMDLTSQGSGAVLVPIHAGVPQHLQGRVVGTASPPSQAQAARPPQAQTVILDRQERGNAPLIAASASAPLGESGNPLQPSTVGSPRSTAGSRGAGNKASPVVPRLKGPLPPLPPPPSANSSPYANGSMMGDGQVESPQMSPTGEPDDHPHRVPAEPDRVASPTNPPRAFARRLNSNASQDLAGCECPTHRSSLDSSVLVPQMIGLIATKEPQPMAEAFIHFEPEATPPVSPHTQSISSPIASARRRNPARSPSGRGGGTPSRFGSSNNLLVPFQLPGQNAAERHAARKASLQALMESSLTDHQPLVQQWSNSPVGQIDISALDGDFFGSLQMKVQLRSGEPKTTVRMSGNAIHQNMILIGIDDSDYVFIWNICAVASTGLSVQDAVHKRIENFLADDFSVEMIKRMRAALHSGRAPPVCRLKLVSLLNCTTTVRATAATVELSDGRTHGIAIIARQEEEIDKTNNVFLARYRNAELLHELRQPVPADPVAAQRRQQRIEFIVEHSTWEYVSNVALLMTEWEPVSPEMILADLSRKHLAKVDVVTQKSLPETVECDATVISGIVDEIAAAASGKFSLSMGQRPLKGIDIACIEIVMSGIPLADVQQPILANAELKRCVDSVCGTLSMLDGTTVLLRFPCSQLTNLSPSGSVSSRQGSPMSPSMVLPGVPLTFLLYENKAIFRHNVSTTIWSRGYALCVVDGPRSTERTIKSGLREIHAAIVDMDGSRSCNGILEFLKAYPQITVYCCGEDDVPPARATNYRRKPLTRAVLGLIMEEVAEAVSKRKREEQYIEEQRRIFSTQRSSPWKKGTKLGSGAFADVYEATSVLTGGKMAVKMIWMSALNGDRVKELMNEIDILCKLSHPNIIHYFYCEKGTESVNLFMELCEGGSLQKFINEKAPRPEWEVAHIVTQIVRAVAYLHEEGFVHRDIKPGNVLIGREGKVKLSDFGTAAKLAGGKPTLTDTTGTFKYMAPEVIRGEPYGTACDIWSLGVVVLDLMKLELPHLKAHSALTLDEYYQHCSHIDLPPKLSAHSDALSFVGMCLSMQQSERPSAKSLLVHPFLAEKTGVTSVPTYRRVSQAPLALQSLPPRRMSRIPELAEVAEASNSATGFEVIARASRGPPSPSALASTMKGEGFVADVHAFNSSLQSQNSCVSEIMPQNANNTPPGTTYVFPVDTPRDRTPAPPPA